MHRRTVARSALAVALAAALTACGGSSSDEVTVTAITVSPASSLLALGTSRAFTASAHYSDGSEQDVTASATWATSSAAVLRLGTPAAAGVQATGAALGVAQVSAALGGVTGSASVTVTAATLQAIAVTGDTTLPIGIATPLTATGLSSDGKVRDLTATVTWTSSDPTVATVSAGGLVEPVAVGTAVVSAAYSGLSGTVTVRVTAATLDAIDVFPGALSLATGTTAAFTAVGTFSDGTLADVTTTAAWTADSGAVLLSSPGSGGVIASAAEVGTATVTAALGGVAGTASVTVTAAQLTSLAVAPAVLSLPSGLSEQLTVTGTFTDGSSQDLTAQVSWTSSDDAVAAVSSAPGTEGLVLGVSPGAATVTATLFGVSAGADVRVTSAALQAVTVTPSVARVAAGYQVRFTATGAYSDGGTYDMTRSAGWFSSDTAVATVVAIGPYAGTATGLIPGTVTITATLDGLAGTATLTVGSAKLVSVAVTPAPFTVAVAGPQQLRATGTFSDASTADITRQCVWSSSSKPVAVVSRAGVVTGVSAGQVTITAKRSGKLGRASGEVQ